MAIIKPSAKFDGGELNINNSVPYIKEGVRRAEFTKKINSEGAWMYFLPAYRLDDKNRGVWYKRLTIRDQFGTNYKEKYFVPSRESDPAEYFANNFKMLYPEDAKIRDVVNEQGQKRKQYPSYGRIAERVLYNVAFANKLEAGAHVLDLPLRNGADGLMGWLDGKDLHGNPRPLINDPERSLPVFIRMLTDTANPWVLQVESSSPAALPEALADADYLYNLEEVLVHKPKEDIIAKLREMYSANVFDDCMDGYPGLTKRAVQAPPAPQAPVEQVQATPVAPTPQPAPIARPTMTVAKPTMGGAPAVPPPPATVAAVNVPPAMPTAPVAPVGAPAPADLSSLPRNPMAGGLDRNAAAAFLNS